MICIFSLYSCKSNSIGEVKPKPAICTINNIVQFPQDAKSRLYFKDSSYWIYQDSIGGGKDSFWVEASKHSIYNSDFGKILYKKCYEAYAYKLQSDYYGQTNVQLYPEHINDDSTYDKEIFSVIYTVEELNYLPIYRFWMSGNKYLTNQEGGEFDTIQNLMVKGKSYDVLHLRNPQNNFDIYKDAYFARDIGLVKFIRKDNSVWELVKYKIKQ
jgi:hypothetical protein